MKERIYDARRRHSGWNPYNLNENIEINNSPLGGEVLEMKDENNKNEPTK